MSSTDSTTARRIAKWGKRLAYLIGFGLIGIVVLYFCTSVLHIGYIGLESGPGRPHPTVTPFPATATPFPDSSLQAPHRPDLVVFPPVLDRPVVAVGGVFELSLRVDNRGSDSSEATTLRYYQSSDSTIDTSDKQLATISVSSLTSSHLSEEKMGMRPIAPSTPGTYYYGACVDAVPNEVDTTNNCSNGTLVTVIASKPPRVVRHVDDITVAVGESFTVDLSSVFSGVDGAEIVDHGVFTPTQGIVTGSTSRKTRLLTITGNDIGETAVIVDVLDSYGNWREVNLFKVTVVPAQTVR